MGFITKSQVKKAISLGTLNPKVIDEFFHDIKFKSYDYDYLIQDQLIDLYTQKNNFKTEVINRNDSIMDAVRDGFRDKVGILQIDKSIVIPGKRKDFKHYSLYNKPLKQEDMMNRRDLFKYGILTFINGVLNTNFKVQPRDDKTFLLFPYTAFDTKVTDTDVISTVMIPECLIAVSRNMTISDMGGSKAIKDQVFENTKKSYFNECKGFMAFFIRANSQYRPLFYTDVKYDYELGVFKFPDIPASIEGYYIVLIGMESYKETITVAGNQTYFSIPRYNMPVPKSNLIVMIQDSNGYSYSINTGEVGITEYYPNIYKVDNPTRKSFKVIVLYSNKVSNDLIEYDSEMDYYLDLINLLDRYREGTVPDILSEYKPIDWDYLISDYEKTIGIPTPTSDPWFPFLYKLKKISSIYKLWCLFFQTYLRRTYGFLESWLMDVSKIDLPSKIRTSTLPEIPMSSDQYKPFSKPMYMFSYKNYANYDKETPYGWFIDGVFAVPEYIGYIDGYQYVYFDAELIKPDSLIEVERYDGNTWSKLVKINGTSYEGTINWLERPTLMNTLFLTDEDGNYLTSGEYKVTVQDSKNLDKTWFDIDMDKSVFIIENGMKIKIEATSSEYMNKKIYIHCNNKSASWNFDATYTPNFSGYNLNVQGNVDKCKKNIIPRIRIFNSKGRMYPRYAYLQEEHTNVNEIPEFQVFADVSQGIPFKVQYLGYDEKIVYQQDEIPKKGLINLEGKLDKPFSLVYHTVFLDGYKLSEKHIKQVSPFKIAIQNVTFVHDLIIYERVHGDELFNFTIGDDVKSSYIADRLLDEDPVFYDEVLRNLNEIIVDPNIPDMDDEIDMMLALIKRELAIKFINMDDIHTPEEYDIYESIFIDGWRLFLNADTRVDKAIPHFNWFYMNHDYNIDIWGK
jgi:hypothetical protein